MIADVKEHRLLDRAHIPASHRCEVGSGRNILIPFHDLPMRIVIIAPGSRGDVQPYVALGLGLKSACHEVRIVTTRDHASLVTAHGLELWSADIDVQAALQQPESSSSLESGKLFRSFRQLSKLASSSASLIAQKALDAAQGADKILAGFGGLFVGAAISEKMGIPLIQAYNVPFTPTREIPGALTPGLGFWPKGFCHQLGHRITRQSIWLTARLSANKARRSVLGLRSAPLLGPFHRAGLGAGTTLYGFSESVIPRPSDWGQNISITGFWFLDPNKQWTPPPELVSFLENGPKPIYIGFGSMSSRDPKKTADMVLEAISRAGQRAILHTGWGGLGKENLGPDACVVESIPHAWLFDRVAAVVHHGGAGTTAAGIRAGVPSVVIPFHGDQPFWGQLVSQLGLGPHPVARRDLTAQRLARAIEAALKNREYRDKAAAMAARIRVEDGVSRAVELIEASYDDQR